MSLKHELKLINIRDFPSVKTVIFESFAKEKHYKAFYKILCGADDMTVESAIDKMLQNDKFKEEFEAQLNKPEFYANIMSTISESDLEIPIREADFIVEMEDNKLFFFIQEGVEIHVDPYRTVVSRLITNNFDDTLLYKNSNNEWTEYEYYHDNPIDDDVISKIAKAYRDYLAEKELLQ